MEMLHSKCAGLDVHKDSVVACIRIQEGPQAIHKVDRIDRKKTASRLIKRLGNLGFAVEIKEAA